VASAGTALCAASANTLNQVKEIKFDALMTRTAARPLPSGRLTRPAALAFAGAAGVAGVVTLFVGCNPLAAALGAANVGLYAAVYTPLKRVHPVATWVGAVVGAVPPLIGWAAAAGELQPGAAVLAAGLYFWQLPHFMALAWLCRADYARGGHKMLSLVDPRGARTAGCALRNALYLLPLGAAAVALGTATPPFGTESAIATGVLAAAAASFRAKPGDAGARLLFRASLVHLPVWMGAFLAHRVPNTAALRREQAPAALAARWRAALEPRPRMAGPPPAALPGPLLLPPVLGVTTVGRCPSAAACEEGEGGR
jgi:protoheme IX farnesyltransferase